MGLYDYYGNVGTAEQSGSCEIYTSDVGSDLLIRDTGKQARLDAGVATFDNLYMTGWCHSHIISCVCKPEIKHVQNSLASNLPLQNVRYIPSLTEKFLYAAKDTSSSSRHCY